MYSQAILVFRMRACCGTAYQAVFELERTTGVGRNTRLRATWNMSSDVHPTTVWFKIQSGVVYVDTEPNCQYGQGFRLTVAML
jgi:hypothetical protein